jgi:hypothetical protein
MANFRLENILSRFIVVAVALVTVVVAALFFFLDFRGSVERRKGPFPQGIYVWQRHWDEMISNALEQAGKEASSFCILAADVSWKADRASVVRIPIDYTALKNIGKPIGFALRIGPYSGKFDQEAEATVFLAGITEAIITDADKAGVEPDELQIDFDCAESKLDGYREWVRVFCDKIHPVPVIITALPSWLKHRAFTRLVKAADGYVLQVHSLERPGGPEDQITLCDCHAARRWAEQAARIGVGFRVALPTYGYLLAFDKEGHFIGLTAEGPSKVWGKDTTLRTVRSDPTALARLVQAWQQDRPYNLQGVIWYRLPLESDRLNWRWATLSAVMAGRKPHESLRIEVEYPKPKLAEIILVNDGETDLSAKLGIKIECPQQKVVASDGLRGYIITKANPLSICLEYHGENRFSTIRVGERWKIGWIRFRCETEVKAHVSKLQP